MTTANNYPVVTIAMENGATIKAELYPHQAPNTVANFISLINKHFYDGLIFHRVIPGFVIQGGCPEGSGMGGPGYSIPHEFLRDENDLESYLPHSRGVLSMARAAHPDSAGSQFFIMVADTPYLDRQYASFGRVIEGIEVVDEIVALPRDHNDRPEKPPRIGTMTVDTHGESYPEPTTL